MRISSTCCKKKEVIDGEEDGSIIVFCSTMIGSGLKVERMKDPLMFF